jgi:hypothetical protein
MKLTIAASLLAGSVLAVGLTFPGRYPVPSPRAGASGPGEGGKAPDFGDGGKADDPVRRAILSGAKIPRTVLEIRQRLQSLGGKQTSHLVANGGHENPFPGRRDVLFMCFNTYAGPAPGGKIEEDELFFGFFLGEDNGTVTVSQDFMELVAWDRTKRLYNYWQMVSKEWHYRGDTAGILADTADINLGKAGAKPGGGVRCAGCHILGGPVMKEIDPPHNDWFTAGNKLPLGTLKLEPGQGPDTPAGAAARLFAGATDAGQFSRQVKKGIDRLLDARAAQKGDGLSLKQQLRSLFSTMEMNLVCDTVPFRERERTGKAVEIPQDFFVDARLVGQRQTVPVAIKVYKQGLQKVGSRFAPDETPGLVETRHAFVVPARSYIDNRVIDSLIRQGFLDDGLVAAVLAVDFTTPVYSQPRAALIRYVPDKARNAAELRAKLIAALKRAPQDPAAQELFANLTNPKRDAAFHRKAAVAYLKACAQAAARPETVEGWLRLASQRREEILHAQTTRSRRDNITEPGFRLIFPVDRLQPVPGRLRLSPATGTVGP